MVAAAAAEFVFFFFSPPPTFSFGFLFLVLFSSHGGDPCLLLGEEGTVEGRGSLPLFLY
jgi:hypothetical protein